MKSFGKFLVVVGLIMSFVYLPTGLVMLFVGIVMFLVGKDTNVTREIAKRQSQERPCPFCKEPILKSAVKCKHCQSDVTPEEEEPSLNDLIVIESGQWECKDCHTKMLIAGDICVSCREHKKDIAIRK